MEVEESFDGHRRKRRHHEWNWMKLFRVPLAIADRSKQSSIIKPRVMAPNRLLCHKKQGKRGMHVFSSLKQQQQKEIQQCNFLSVVWEILKNWWYNELLLCRSFVLFSDWNYSMCKETVDWTYCIKKRKNKTVKNFCSGNWTVEQLHKYSDPITLYSKNYGE